VVAGWVCWALLEEKKKKKKEIRIREKKRKKRKRKGKRERERLMGKEINERGGGCLPRGGNGLDRLEGKRKGKKERKKEKIK